MIVETQKIIWNINILNGKECHNTKSISYSELQFPG